MTHSQSRTELKRFSTRAEATNRTLHALANLGFSVERNTDTIEDLPVGTYNHSSLDERRRYGEGERKPDIAARYVDPDTGNIVLLGMDVAPANDLIWPFDWSGKTLKMDSAESTVLARGGNHDNSQRELGMQITGLLAAAHFDVDASSVPTDTPDYQQWAEDITVKLDPIYGDSQANAT